MHVSCHFVSSLQLPLSWPVNLHYHTHFFSFSDVSWVQLFDTCKILHPILQPDTDINHK